MSKSKPLTFNVLAKCSKSKARTGVMKLPHHDVETPVFMPVGTQVCLFEHQINIRSYARVLTSPISGDDERNPAGSIRKFELPNNFSQHISFRKPTWNQSYFQSWGFAQVHGMEPLSVDGFGRIPNGLIVETRHHHRRRRQIQISLRRQ